MKTISPVFCAVFACFTAALVLPGGAACARSAAAPVAPVVRLVSPGVPVIANRDIIEVSVTLGQTYANPFDPDEVAVDAVATGPKGQTLRVPGFWFQPFRRETGENGAVRLAAKGEPGWRVRVCPTAPGPWHVTVTVKDKSGTAASGPLAFTALPLTNKRAAGTGWVRRAPGKAAARYFALDDGTGQARSCFLVGENVCWPGSRGLADYDDWFPALAKSGGNFARLWMAFSPLESKETGLGRYSLQNAAHFDEVLALARKHDLRCMVAFGTYGEFNTGGFFNEGSWPANPYNAANGGPVASDKPNDFFSNETARTFYKRRLRYLVARYGAYTSVGFWEFWNEKDVPAAWAKEMAGALKTLDPYQHLVTNSASTVGPADVWQLPTFDLTQTHRYGDEGSIRDIAPVISEDARAHDVFNKPHLMGEFGISWRNGDEKFDPSGRATNLHNGLWAGALSGSAGGAAIWWWDGYVHPKNLYKNFTGLARFAARVDWPRRDFRPLSLPAPTVPQTGAETFSNLVLTPTGVWGDKSTGVVTVGRGGLLSGGKILGVLAGPAKPDLRSPLTLAVDLPRPSRLVVRVVTVSDHASLRVSVDGKTAADFPFSAAPAPGNDYESTKQFPEYNNIYQAVFNKDRAIPLPAGRHTITLENTDGDWLSLGALTLEGAKSSRYAVLRPLALQDKTTGETLVWLQDPESNWWNDRAGRLPESYAGVTLHLSVPGFGPYRVEWWHTRAGKVLRTEDVMPSKGRLTLMVPAFTRDVALRAVPLRPNRQAARR